ncbi:UNVERIFIED_ORG: hypothetical protein J2Y78_001800 [Buttiauxella agrestis ATCC 33320]
MEKVGDGAAALLLTCCHLGPYFWLFTLVFITGGHRTAGLAFLEFASFVVVVVG